MDKKKGSKRIIAVSNVFSGLGALASACCSGPGIIACSVACASSCGSAAYSIFGLSFSAVTNWAEQFFYILIGFSVAFHLIAFWKVFIKKHCHKSHKPEILFYVSVLITLVVFVMH